jgi:hypothetical protein
MIETIKKERKAFNLTQVMSRIKIMRHAIKKTKDIY